MRQATIGRPWIFLVFVHHTDWICQYRSREKEPDILWVLVLCLSNSRHVRVAQTGHFHIHKVVAEQVEEDVVANEVPLKVTVRNISLTSKISRKLYQLKHWLVHIVQSPQTNGQLPVEFWNSCHNSTTF